MSEATFALLERMPLGEDAEVLAEETMSLSKILHGLGKQPFTPESVERYKQERAEKANAWLWVHRLAPALFLIGWLGVLGGYSIACGAVMAQASRPFIVGVALLLSSLVALGAMLALLPRVGVEMTERGIRVKGKARWEATPYPQYQGVIPGRILLEMVEITANLPTVAFVVHQLVQEKRVIDPFLEVCSGHERYCIAVWDDDGSAA